MIRLESLYGPHAKSRISMLASFRIHYFREFPYLYDGTMEYEMTYLDGFFNHPEACLIIGWDGERAIGVSTSIPLISDYEIARDAETLFSQSSLEAQDFMYFGEIILVPEYRGQGLFARIFAEQELEAARKGYSGTCFLAVERDRDHPLWPEGYVQPWEKWIHLGYRKTPMVTDFNWPTLQRTGISVDQQNPMAFWVKEF